MLSDIWTKTLWDQRRLLLGWAIGFGAVALIYTAFFPFAATPEYEELLAGMPPALIEAFGWDEISTAYGYIGSTVYGLLGSVLMSVMAIGLGARAIAGGEEDGSLEILITMPVTRTRVVIHKTLALVVATLMAGVIVWLAVMAIREPIDLDLGASNLAAASLDLMLLGALFGTFTILAGSIVGRRGVAVGSGAGLAVVTFLINGLAPLTDATAWMQKFSPFYWFDAKEVLKKGLEPGMTLLLAAVTIALAVLSVIALNRRDVRGT